MAKTDTAARWDRLEAARASFAAALREERQLPADAPPSIRAWWADRLWLARRELAEARSAWAGRGARS